ncbi:M28 family metallopeptidase [Aliidiomarina maris]|uniref:Peptidase M28 n=1 Tax=Aliidiomarina maris TaxID=531312 RepID=A0A327WPB4_9GAMM|nr:M28 family metallopeptidase [Aliidiomarina maris]MBA3988430.1 peptidase M28 [Idiomarina sp.]MCL5049868.1 M28 family metallopeptidase [Bacillota bacterium]RAJ93574.1 Zn-dependent M28 family amino/carboxypeptidase [Aliidiomarina maris]RUO18794.1 peptidase M28 [Aliidiomarina maris]
MRQLTLLAAMSVLATACSPAQTPSDSSQTDTHHYEPQVDADGYVDYHFNDQYREHLRVLSSDEFEGRAPGTRGEELTIEYTTAEFERLGVQPLNGDSYLQPVPLVRIAPTRVTNLSLQHDGASSEFRYREQMMAWTPRVVDEVSVEASEMVFVGYGIVAPEFDWNDYEGLDVEGKTVVMFVNDPGYATQDDALFTGNAMTYYGRWTYKFEEAARQGATGAIIIHETGPAGYGWGVIAGGSPVRFDLARENRNMHRSEIEGWITAESAEALFANVGMSLEEAHAKALSQDFSPVALNTQMSMTVENEFEYIDTHNIAGYIPGSSYPDEHIIYMAHWDHLGVEPISGDIYNGAQDNASGTAGVLSIAEEFANGEQPERSVVFLLVGAEERGLLGSAWYADNPLLPLEQAVAGINMDVLNVYGPMRDFVVVGWENSDMQDYAAPFVEMQNRYLAPETNPEAGIFYRSDHFSLAKQGVPVLYAKGGNDHFEQGQAWGEEQRAIYNAEAYHKPGDEYDPEWDLRGAHQDMWIYFRVGQQLANSRDWPRWAQGNEFEALRLESAQQRQP